MEKFGRAEVEAFISSLRGPGDCDRYIERVKAWGYGIISARLEYDADIEKLLKDAGHTLVTSGGQSSDAGKLRAFLEDWVTPSPSVSPSARLGWWLPPELVAEGRQRIAASRGSGGYNANRSVVSG